MTADPSDDSFTDRHAEEEITVRTTHAPATPRPSEEPLAPRLLVDGRYRVEAELGRGGMGVVYLARDAWLDRAVALKVIAPGRTGDVDVARSFHNEAKALAALRSQHIVQVYAFGLHDHAYYFAMEYVRGRSLRAIMSEHAAHGEFVPIHRALTILGQIADGLAVVHARDIVHRDVKPSNILVEQDTGRPVLVDFGLATHTDGSAPMRLAGTPHYMAPERFVAGQRLTAQTDLYALGCVAFEVFTGRCPYEGRGPNDLLRLMSEPAPRVSSLRPDLAAFDDVVARALAPDPKDRWESCAAFAAALLDAGRRGDESAPAARGPEAEPPPRTDGIIRALVVDDDPVSRKFASAAVQYVFSLRVAVTSAGSGFEAVERAEKELPDLVILDYDMPGLDGVDTLSRLRSLPGGDRIRVLVLSGHVAEVQRWRFSVLGVQDFESKPVDFNRLAEQIAAIGRRLG